MYRELVEEFLAFAKEKVGYEEDPTIEFIEDETNSQDPMGYTGSYEPSKKTICVYVANRHPKDILRSVAHELIHHIQNCRGDDMRTMTTNTDEDENLKGLEEEAFLESGMLMKQFQEAKGGYPMEEGTKAPEKETRLTEKTEVPEKDYHQRRNDMLHDMLLRKFRIKKGEK